MAVLQDISQSDESVVEALEALLIQAKAGELRSLAAFGTVHGGSFQYKIVGMASDTKLIGRLEWLKAMLIYDMMEFEEF